MNECPECSRSFYGNKCQCGFQIRKQQKSLEILQPTAPAYFVETFSDAKLTKPVYGTVTLQKCIVNGCQNPGTMTRSIAHESSESAKWVCRNHFR